MFAPPILQRCYLCRSVQLQISDITSRKLTASLTRQNQTIINKLCTLDRRVLKPFRVEVARKLLFEYLVERRAPFLEIESPALKRLLEYLDPRSVKAITIANTIRAGCIRYFEIAKTTVIKALSQNYQKKTRQRHPLII